MDNFQIVLDRIRDGFDSIIPYEFKKCQAEGHQFFYYQRNANSSPHYVCERCGWQKLPFLQMYHDAIAPLMVFNTRHKDYVWSSNNKPEDSDYFDDTDDEDDNDVDKDDDNNEEFEDDDDLDIEIEEDDEWPNENNEDDEDWEDEWDDESVDEDD